MLKYNSFIKFFVDIGQIFWVLWSNFRFRKTERYSKNIRGEDRLISLVKIRSLAKKFYKSFEYTEDGADQLYDAMIPPSHAYKEYCKGLLKDDCDGFHSLAYHCLQASDIEDSYLLTTHARGSGHCTTVFKYDGLWYGWDYTRIYGGTDSLEALIVEHNKYYEETYSHDKPVYHNAFFSYDYDKGKFKFLNFKKILEKGKGEQQQNEQKEN